MEILKKTGSVFLKIFKVLLILIVAASAKVLVKSLGIVAFIPTGTAFLYYLILKSLKKEADDWFRVAVGVQAGQLTWFMLALLFAHRQSALLDISILLVGITWFFFRPFFLSSMLLSIYQVLGIVLNCVSFSHTASSYTEATLFLHIALRSIALIALVGNYLKYVNVSKIKAAFTKNNIKTGLPFQNPNERLLQLKRLFDEGLINEEDYKQKKLEILNSI